MSRNVIVADIFAKSPWCDWQIHPIAIDASTRAYARLLGPNDQSVILMDADPATDTSFETFMRIGTFLTKNGLAAPNILQSHPDLGVAVLEDLGAKDFAKWANDKPQDAAELYEAAAEVLIKLHKIKPPLGLSVIDPDTAGKMVAETINWYADCDITALADAVTTAYQKLTTKPDIIALRDFHAENLIWRPDQTGLARVGLLDFQDAILAPAGYDLMSLLRDVRRDVDSKLGDDLIANFAAKIQMPLDQFTAQCACLSAQRNLRILGVFARLIQRDGKPKYAAFMQRVWSHIMTDLAHPALCDLASVVTKELPPPIHSKISEAL